LKTISLLHPFSAEAIGLEEEDFYYSHSKPHQLALEQFQQETGNKVSISYFTPNRIPYKKEFSKIEKYFWPVTSPWGKRASHWRAQHSLWHYYAKPSNVTIINMSGHGSKYTFNYAKKLKQKNLGYIPMIGGINMSLDGKALTYYKNAHHLLVHTKLQQQKLLAHPNFSNFDIRVLPLGINLNKFKPSYSEEQDTKFNLLFVGRIMALKRVDLIIDVVKALKDANVNCNLRIIGFTGDKGYYNQLQEKIKKLELTDCIEFLGTIKQENLVNYYQKADLLLLPSEHESFGMVMVEAMACGTPVAAIANTGGADEIVSNQIDGLLCTKDEYVAEIQNLFQNPEKLKSFGKEARKKVEEEYSINTTYKILHQSITDGLKSMNNEQI
jgi:glycosyltransferase involved in cell wall biosynthesis